MLQLAAAPPKNLTFKALGTQKTKENLWIPSALASILEQKNSVLFDPNKVWVTPQSHNKFY